jgi:signal transduction histidine kinase
VGIPDDARERLFKPFFTTKARGTGLGLASSRAIAESHEGSLDVENAAGGGTRFCLRLPASAKAEESDA